MLAAPIDLAGGSFEKEPTSDRFCDCPEKDAIDVIYKWAFHHVHVVPTMEKFTIHCIHHKSRTGTPRAPQ